MWRVRTTTRCMVELPSLMFKQHFVKGSFVISAPKTQRCSATASWCKYFDVQQSIEWQHYEIHRREPNILLFRRPIQQAPPAHCNIMGSSITRVQDAPVHFTIAPDDCENHLRRIAAQAADRVFWLCALKHERVRRTRPITFSSQNWKPLIAFL